MSNLMRWSPLLLASMFAAAFVGRMIYRYRQRRNRRQWYHASGAQRPADDGFADTSGLYATRSGAWSGSGDGQPSHAHGAHFAGGAGGAFDGGGASGDWSGSASDSGGGFGGGDSGRGDGGGGGD